MSSQSHAERAHAKLSASGSERWRKCPGSVRLEQSIPDQTTSYAEEGTKAHEYAEMLLRCYLGGNDGADIAVVEEFQKTDRYFNEEMANSIGVYIDYVLERFNEAKARTPDAAIYLESRLDFSDWVPDGFGTGDVVIIADGIMDVIDLKYGKGVQKYACEEDPQLRLYGLGALNEFGWMYDIQTVRMTIFQPRLDHTSIEEISIVELLKWAEEDLKPSAELAASLEGDCHAGEHCRFCKAKTVCKTRSEYNLELISEEFNEPELLSEMELADILSRAKSIQNWVKDIIDFTLQQALSGVKYPGYKVVEGRAKRKYVDTEKVAKTLESNGYSEASIFKPRELLGLTDMGKLVGVKKLPEILGDLLITPNGAPTLVPETDKRPEWSSADKYFGDLDL